MTWDWILALLGMFGLYLTTKKMVAGFVVGASLQVLWLTYALSTSQYGFVLSAVGFGFVNLLGIYRWTRPKTQPINDQRYLAITEQLRRGTK